MREGVLLPVSDDNNATGAVTRFTVVQMVVAADVENDRSTLLFGISPAEGKQAVVVQHAAEKDAPGRMAYAHTPRHEYPPADAATTFGALASSTAFSATVAAAPPPLRDTDDDLLYLWLPEETRRELARLRRSNAAGRCAVAVALGDDDDDATWVRMAALTRRLDNLFHSEDRDEDHLSPSLPDSYAVPLVESSAAAREILGASPGTRVRVAVLHHLGDFDDSGPPRRRGKAEPQLKAHERGTERLLAKLGNWRRDEDAAAASRAFAADDSEADAAARAWHDEVAVLVSGNNSSSGSSGNSGDSSDELLRRLSSLPLPRTLAATFLVQQRSNGELDMTTLRRSAINAAERSTMLSLASVHLHAIAPRLEHPESSAWRAAMADGHGGSVVARERTLLAPACGGGDSACGDRFVHRRIYTHAELGAHTPLHQHDLRDARMLDEVEHSGEGGAVTTALSRHSVSVPASAVARDCDTYMSAKHAPCGGSDGGESEGDGLPRELETNPPVTFETSHSMERIAYMEFDPTDPAVRRLVELTDIPLDLEGRRVLAEDETFQARESTERGSSKRRFRVRRRTSSSPAAEPSWPLSDLEPADGGAPLLGLGAATPNTRAMLGVIEDLFGQVDNPGWTPKFSEISSWRDVCEVDLVLPSDFEDLVGSVLKLVGIDTSLIGHVLDFFGCMDIDLGSLLTFLKGQQTIGQAADPTRLGKCGFHFLSEMFPDTMGKLTEVYAAVEALRALNGGLLLESVQNELMDSVGMRLSEKLSEVLGLCTQYTLTGHDALGAAVGALHSALDVRLDMDCAGVTAMYINTVDAACSVEYVEGLALHVLSNLEDYAACTSRMLPVGRNGDFRRRTGGQLAAALASELAVGDCGERDWCLGVGSGGMLAAICQETGICLTSECLDSAGLAATINVAACACDGSDSVQSLMAEVSGHVSSLSQGSGSTCVLDAVMRSQEGALTHLLNTLRATPFESLEGCLRECRMGESGCLDGCPELQAVRVRGPVHVVTALYRLLGASDAAALAFEDLAAEHPLVVSYLYGSGDTRGTFSGKTTWSVPGHAAIDATADHLFSGMATFELTLEQLLQHVLPALPLTEVLEAAHRLDSFLIKYDITLGRVVEYVRAAANFGGDSVSIASDPLSFVEEYLGKHLRAKVVAWAELSLGAATAELQVLCVAHYGGGAMDAREALALALKQLSPSVDLLLGECSGVFGSFATVSAPCSEGAVVALGDFLVAEADSLGACLASKAISLDALLEGVVEDRVATLASSWPFSQALGGLAVTCEAHVAGGSDALAAAALAFKGHLDVDLVGGCQLALLEDFSIGAPACSAAYLEALSSHVAANAAALRDCLVVSATDTSTAVATMAGHALGAAAQSLTTVGSVGALEDSCTAIRNGHADMTLLAAVRALSNAMKSRVSLFDLTLEDSCMARISIDFDTGAEACSSAYLTQLANYVATNMPKTCAVVGSLDDDAVAAAVPVPSDSGSRRVLFAARGYIEAEVGAMTDTSNRDGLAAMCQVHLDAGATAFDAALAAVDQHVLSRAPAAFDASLGAGACASVLATFGGSVEAACSLEYLEDLGSFVLQRVVALSACAVTKVASGGTGLSSRIREVSALTLEDPMEALIGVAEARLVNDLDRMLADKTDEATAVCGYFASQGSSALEAAAKGVDAVLAETVPVLRLSLGNTECAGALSSLSTSAGSCSVAYLDDFRDFAAANAEALARCSLHELTLGTSWQSRLLEVVQGQVRLQLVATLEDRAPSLSALCVALFGAGQSALDAAVGAVSDILGVDLAGSECTLALSGFSTAETACGAGWFSAFAGHVDSNFDAVAECTRGKLTATLGAVSTVTGIAQGQWPSVGMSLRTFDLGGFQELDWLSLPWTLDDVGGDTALFGGLSSPVAGLALSLLTKGFDPVRDFVGEMGFDFDRFMDFAGEDGRRRRLHSVSDWGIGMPADMVRACVCVCVSNTLLPTAIRKDDDGGALRRRLDLQEQNLRKRTQVRGRRRRPSGQGRPRRQRQ